MSSSFVGGLKLPVTQWFCDDDFTAGSSIHPWGQRFVQHVFPSEVTNEGDSDAITIYDFNPNHVREMRLSKEHVLAARERHLDDFKIDVFGRDVPGNICFRKNIFRFDIIGKLPYIRYGSSNWPEYENVFIDEERLICVQASILCLLAIFVLTLTGNQADKETDGITASMDIVYFG
jgi:hypothetical protein